MEACELVRLLFNKTVIQKEPTRARNPGYGQLTAVRTLVYTRPKGLQNDTRIIKHLKEHPNDTLKLGLHKTPNRTTIGRWRRRCLHLLKAAFKKTVDIIQMLIPTTHLIAESTPLVDLYDLETKWGFSSRGPFKGFKLHVAVNQLGLPLKAILSPDNRFDSIFRPKLIEDIEAKYVLTDAGYHSLRNIEAVKAASAIPIIAVNPRQRGKQSKVSNSSFLGVNVTRLSSLTVMLSIICLRAPTRLGQRAFKKVCGGYGWAGLYGG